MIFFKIAGAKITIFFGHQGTAGHAQEMRWKMSDICSGTPGQAARSHLIGYSPLLFEACTFLNKRFKAKTPVPPY